jgi:phosphoglycolate phosphatase-like HAD superfamily hydrolase
MTDVREDVAMSAPRTAFLVDVDDTLLDNDRFRDDLQQHLEQAYGAAARSAYWAIQERRFGDLGYRDYLGAVQEWWESDGRDPRFVAVSGYLLEYPFADRLYPGALEVLARLRELGPTIVLTDGDAVFQPSKVARAGIGDASDALLVYVHKEEELEDVERRFPADRYVLVDDKVRILAAAKLHWGERVTTVLPKTGQFANDPDLLAAHPAPDVTIAGIGDLLDRQDVLGG